MMRGKGAKGRKSPGKALKAWNGKCRRRPVPYLRDAPEAGRHRHQGRRLNPRAQWS